MSHGISHSHLRIAPLGIRAGTFDSIKIGADKLNTPLFGNIFIIDTHKSGDFYQPSGNSLRFLTRSFFRSSPNDKPFMARRIKPWHVLEARKISQRCMRIYRGGCGVRLLPLSISNRNYFACVFATACAYTIPSFESKSSLA